MILHMEAWASGSLGCEGQQRRAVQYASVLASPAPRTNSPLLDHLVRQVPTVGAVHRLCPLGQVVQVSVPGGLELRVVPCSGASSARPLQRPRPALWVLTGPSLRPACPARPRWHAAGHRRGQAHPVEPHARHRALRVALLLLLVLIDQPATCEGASPAISLLPARLTPCPPPATSTRQLLADGARTGRLHDPDGVGLGVVAVPAPVGQTRGHGSYQAAKLRCSSRRERGREERTRQLTLFARRVRVSTHALQGKARPSTPPQPYARTIWHAAVLRAAGAGRGGKAVGVQQRRAARALVALARMSKPALPRQGLHFPRDSAHSHAI
jgi:hypothetical protein